MNTEHILFYPHKEYNTEKEITDNLRIKDCIQYGYIKLRDLNRWLNNEIVSVKMGMLSPSNKTYRGLTILESVIRRIKEQDTTALFDDDDELIPIYVFISTETDNEWRNYLLAKGFVSSRKNASREGIKIKKSDIGLHYGEHYGYDTEEVLSKRERRAKEIEEYEKRRAKERDEYEKRRAREVEKYKQLIKENTQKQTEEKAKDTTHNTIMWIFYGIVFVVLSMLLPLAIPHTFKQTDAEKSRSEFVADSIRQERQRMYEIACERVEKELKISKTPQR